MSTFFVITFAFLFPALMLFLKVKYKRDWISPIVFCYLLGIIIGNLNLTFDTQASSLISEISVSLAIPILLFSSNLIGWLKHSRKTFLSFFFGVISVILSSTVAYFIFSEQLENGWKVAGMMIGVYTGGTPNMSAIGLGLDVNKEIFVLLNSADIALSSIYFLFLITFAKKFLSLFLPEFNPVIKSEKETEISEKPESLSFSRRSIMAISISIGTAVLILGTGVGISFLIFNRMQPAIIILIITTLGIAASFIKPIHNLVGTYKTAEYLLLIFAVSIGSLANFSELAQQSSSIFYFAGFVLISSISLHFLLALVTRIDTDTLFQKATFKSGTIQAVRLNEIEYNLFARRYLFTSTLDEDLKVELTLVGMITNSECMRSQ